MPPEEITLDEDAKWSRATFRVWSDTMSPEAIAGALGIEPTELHRKGEPVSKRTAAVRKEHCIRIKSSLPTSEPLQRHLESLCDLIEPLGPKLAAIADRCECDIFCGFSSGNGQGGFSLSPQLLNRLAALKIKLVVDLYPPTAVRPEA